MEKNNRIEDIVKNSIEKIKNVVDTSTIVGEPVEYGGKTLLPVTKITMGFVTGGGEYATSEKVSKEGFPYAGGVATGINVTPIGFVIIDENKSNFIKIDNTEPLEKLINVLPKIVDSVSKMIKDKK